jgi:inositol phosphorylceramide mannosyltransferase catalytic subunit
MTSTSGIPKRIIQTGKSANLPLKERAAAANLQLLNPSFEYLFFDDRQVEDFIDQYFPSYRKVFESFRFKIQKFDFFRYLAVYQYGGFYFDLDVFLAKDLSDLIQFGAVFPFEGLTMSRYLRRHLMMDWQIGNYGFGATPNHPFLLAVIENCVRAQTDAHWVEPMMKGVPPLSRAEFFILNSTGPGLLSRTLAERPELATDMSVLFPTDVCDTSCWNRFGDFGLHMMDGSWRMSGGFLRRRLAQRWEVWMMQRLMHESRLLGPTRNVSRFDSKLARGAT